MEAPRVLFIDDESCFRQGIEISLKDAFGDDAEFKIEYHAHPLEAIESIKANPFNVFLVFMDHHFRDGKTLHLGADYIQAIKRINAYTEVVMMSGDTSPESLRLWLKNGADKFIYKDFNEQQQKLQIFISEALTKFKTKFGGLLDNKKSLVQRVPDVLKKIGVVSSNSYMKAAAELVLQSATSDLSVLIIGETGTGKELFARAIHQNSKRKDKQFRTIDCTQFKKSELIASELFGSERGAFTGAESKPGLLEIANGGTVFLDEVHHLGPEAQAMLLRFIQERKIRRVGGSVEKFVDVRLVFAAKPILSELVAQDQFLIDLIYRIKEIKIDLPKLMNRPEDIEVLCAYFLEKQSSKLEASYSKRFHPDALCFLEKYSWPGNVRELENLIKRLAVLVPGPIILLEHLEKFGELDSSEFSEMTLDSISTLADMISRHENEERALILKVYQACDQNFSETARKLGVARTNLRRRCEALGIWTGMDDSIPRNETESKKDLKRRVDKSIRSMLGFVSEM